MSVFLDVNSLVNGTVIAVRCKWHKAACYLSLIVIDNNTYIRLLIRATVVVQLCYVINVQTGCPRGDPSPLTTTQRPTLNFNSFYMTKEGCIYSLSETFTPLSKIGYCEGTYVKTLECKHHHRLR